MKSKYERYLDPHSTRHQKTRLWTVISIQMGNITGFFRLTGFKFQIPIVTVIVNVCITIVHFLLNQADRDWEEEHGASAEQNLRLAVEAFGRKVPSTTFELISSFLWQSLHQVWHFCKLRTSGMDWWDGSFLSKRKKKRKRFGSPF